MQPLALAQHICANYRRYIETTFPILDDALRQEMLGSIAAHVATHPIERQHLQNEIDTLVAHLYGLQEEELEHILYAPYTFPLVGREVKDGVMAAFARLEEMMRVV